VFQFLNLYLNKILGNDNNLAINIYQSLDKDLPEWSSLEINSISNENYNLFKSIDTKNIKSNFNFRIQFIENKNIHKIWQNNHLTFSGDSANFPRLDQSYNDFVDKLISNEITLFQETLNNSIKNYSPNSFDDTVDSKTLEWIRVSFVVLEKAIIESLTNSDLFFTTKLFLGKNPKNNLLEIRLIIFNLDILYKITSNGLLEITIYDEKNGAPNSSKVPSLHTTTFNKSRECLDQLIHILSLISKGIKIN
jgi:hypothetical protein